MGINMCKVKGCKSSSKSNISLFKSPKNEESRNKWSQALGIKLRINSFVCEKHFLESSIRRRCYKEHDGYVLLNVSLII